jgi:protein xylosyltransferase
MLFHECENHLWRLGPRRLQDGIRIDGGSDWICLHRGFVHYVTGNSDELLIGLKSYWKYALLPAEVVLFL